MFGWDPHESDLLDAEIVSKRDRDYRRMLEALHSLEDDARKAARPVTRAERCKGKCNRLLYRSKNDPVAQIEGSIRASGRGYCGSCYVTAKRRGEF